MIWYSVHQVLPVEGGADGRRRVCRGADEPMRYCRRGCVGKQPVVTDATESVGKDVDQEVADELVGGLQPTGLTRGVERDQLVNLMPSTVGLSYWTFSVMAPRRSTLATTPHGL